jgi:hypothetical protein
MFDIVVVSMCDNVFSWILDRFVLRAMREDVLILCHLIWWVVGLIEKFYLKIWASSTMLINLSSHMKCCGELESKWAINSNSVENNFDLFSFAGVLLLYVFYILQNWYRAYHVVWSMCLCCSAFLFFSCHIGSLENESTIIVRVIMETNFGAPNE